MSKILQKGNGVIDIMELLTNKYAEEIKKAKELIERRNKVTNIIQEKFSFLVPDYVIDDIAEGENYEHICLMINLAESNNRITGENAIFLRNKLKEIGNIKSAYDKFEIKK